MADHKPLPLEGREFKSFCWVLVISNSSPGLMIIKNLLPLISFLPWGAYFYFWSQVRSCKTLSQYILTLVNSDFHLPVMMSEFPHSPDLNEYLSVFRFFFFF